LTRKGGTKWCELQTCGGWGRENKKEVSPERARKGEVTPKKKKRGFYIHRGKKERDLSPNGVIDVRLFVPLRIGAR